MFREPPQKNDELILVQRAVQGEQEAFRALVILYEAKLLLYIMQMLGNEENARDVLQETFVAAFRALPRWTPPNLITPSDQITANVYVIPLAEQAHPLAPWLYRIATNCALNFLKKQPVSRMLSPQRRIEQEYEKQCTSYQEPVDQSMLIENQYVMRESLQEALRRLSPEDAACLVLRFVAGERYVEIAQRLGLSTEAVRKRVTRGILVFRAAYQELDVEVMHDR